MSADLLWIAVADIVLGGIFVAAAIHKLAGFRPFVGILQNYRLLPPALVMPLARGIVFLELLFGLAAMAALIIGTQLGLAGIAALLSVYAMAMALNLVRGNDSIDCGCEGFGVGRVTISWLLVSRNAVLAAVALGATLLPQTSRALGAADWIGAAGAIAALPLLYIGFAQWVTLRSSREVIQ